MKHMFHVRMIESPNHAPIACVRNVIFVNSHAVEHLHPIRLVVCSCMYIHGWPIYRDVQKCIRTYIQITVISASVAALVQGQPYTE